MLDNLLKLNYDEVRKESNRDVRDYPFIDTGCSEKEGTMASLKNAEFRNYCDTVYSELSNMKARLLGFVRDIEHMEGPEKELLKSHISHFQDIIRTIDWKMEILTRACPFEWVGYSGVERTASVLLDEELSREQNVSGGYGGG